MRSGSVLIPLDRAEVEALVDDQARGYRSIAVGLCIPTSTTRMNGWCATFWRERLPGVMVSMSSEVRPQMREYERFNTVVANAYIKPLMKSYLGRLRRRCGRRRDCPIFLMHSGGGIISLESAAEFPVRLVESGPRAARFSPPTSRRAMVLDKVLSLTWAAPRPRFA